MSSRGKYRGGSRGRQWVIPLEHEGCSSVCLGASPDTPPVRPGPGIFPCPEVAGPLWTVFGPRANLSWEAGMSHEACFQAHRPWPFIPRAIEWPRSRTRAIAGVVLQQGCCDASTGRPTGLPDPGTGHRRLRKRRHTRHPLHRRHRRGRPAGRVRSPAGALAGFAISPVGDEYWLATYMSFQPLDLLMGKPWTDLDLEGVVQLWYEWLDGAVVTVTPRY